jgi:hypothetical protein
MQRAGEPLRQIKWCSVVVPVAYVYDEGRHINSDSTVPGVGPGNSYRTGPLTVRAQMCLLQEITKYIDEHRERYKGNGSAMSRRFCDQSKQEKYFMVSGASKISKKIKKREEKEIILAKL